MPPGRSYVFLSELRDELPVVNIRRVASALRRRGIYVHISEAKPSVYRKDLGRVRELLSEVSQELRPGYEPRGANSPNEVPDAPVTCSSCDKPVTLTGLCGCSSHHFRV